MKKQRIYKTQATEEQKQAVLELFYSEQDNSIARIAGMCNLTYNQTDRIVDKELKSKRNSNSTLKRI